MHKLYDTLTGLPTLLRILPILYLSIMNKQLSSFIQAIIIFAATFQFCYAQTNAYTDTFTIKQKDKTWFTINITDSVHLTREAFCMQFENKRSNEKKKQFYATQIAAVTEDSCIKYITAGQRTENIFYLAPGTGLAAEDLGYSNLFIDNEAHHYIMYENEKDRRANKLSQKGDILKLEWCVPQAFYNGADVSFEQLPFNHIYLIIFNDRNLNEIVDDGEYKIISVIFD